MALKCEKTHKPHIYLLTEVIRDIVYGGPALKSQQPGVGFLSVNRHLKHGMGYVTTSLSTGYRGAHKSSGSPTLCKDSERFHEGRDN